MPQSKSVRPSWWKKPGDGEEELQLLVSHERQDARQWAQWLVATKPFTAFVTIAIFLNAIYLGIETDFAEGDGREPEIWQSASDMFFTIAFTAELLLRVFATVDPRCKVFLSDRWNVFDAVLVVTACLDTLLMDRVISAADGSSGEGHDRALGLVAAVRVVRIARVARLVRLLRFFRDFMALVAGIIEALWTLVWAWVLLALLIYVFSIFITRTVGHPHKDEDAAIDMYFGGVMKSMFTLFQVMTTEGWAEVARVSQRHEPWTQAFFIFYLFVTTFAVMNVVVGVVVESTLDKAKSVQSSNEQGRVTQDELEQQELCRKIYGAFVVADTDGDEVLTREEFLLALSTPELMSSLQDAGVDMRQAENLFDILDFDDSESLDAQEFVGGVVRATGQAKAKDLLAVQCTLARSAQRTRGQITTMTDEADRRMTAAASGISELRKDLRVIGQAVAGARGITLRPSEEISPKDPRVDRPRLLKT